MLKVESLEAQLNEQVSSGKVQQGIAVHWVINALTVLQQGVVCQEVEAGECSF
jgi:hypothetical protein